ncbi:hypothetical protein TCAL_03847 [Tigriopus californicus]|uniref:Uncharacterized protein n=1 Tax=Tigriopus californicus TaxID=6832 RepID=A0A553PFD8_TIGCA|nr:NADH dehydrogenase [ubiquinone] 1 beta subcomplex subunit 3-like [Tigriopus californicus]TRY76383.1 hypothetical protein TCAL_03847 [Tigriopus californicus]|eukprot:TCALIF_03847-PA protein Name:"Similar to NDUFB3 NADH dehydrogenase [ubiquinone] 1 beta subcomplex subunit 3 (Pongo pygmaeus)" AED:0.00 eAED:0.00 QI:146/1/1/1/1/1/2/200/92
MGGGVPHIKVPDWKSFVVGDHTPELQKLQNQLAAKGLKDPWIRNEVWRYDTRLGTRGMKGLWRIAFRGFIPGVAVGAGFAALSYMNADDSHH